MRRLLVPAALLVAILALVLLRSARREQAVPERTERPPVGEFVESVPDAAREPEPSRAAPRTEEAGEAPALVHGVVTGKEGVLWCAHVLAYRPGRDDVIADTYTDPEGRYSLAIDVSDVDLAAEPAKGTWLQPSPRRRVVLNAGEDREEHFALGPTASISGRVVDTGTNGLGNIVIVAVRPEHMSRPDAHPNAFAGHIVARTSSGSDGAFRLGGLEAGTYVLATGDPYWTLRDAAVAQADGPEQLLTVVPAVSIDIEVKDIETGEAVDGARVKVQVKDSVALDDLVPAGILSRRVAVDGSTRFMQPSYVLDVSAHGFAPWGPQPWAPRPRHVVWLLPLRDPNTTVRVSFDDGQPYRGDLFVNFTDNADGVISLGVHPDGPKVGSTALERVQDGVFRGALPRGFWTLFVTPRHVLGSPPQRGEIAVTGEGEAQIKFVLPAGGTLVFVPPPGGGARTIHLRAGSAGESNGTTPIQVPPEGTHLEGVPPGVYQLGFERFTYAVHPRNKDMQMRTRTIEWFQEVRVVAGETEEVRLPP